MRGMRFAPNMSLLSRCIFFIYFTCFEVAAAVIYGRLDVSAGQVKAVTIIKGILDIRTDFVFCDYRHFRSPLPENLWLNPFIFYICYILPSSPDNYR
jgi:hypothetical protein